MTTISRIDEFCYIRHMGELLGYARVSTADQNPALQEDALYKAGCFKVFTDHASGSLTERPELERLLDHLRPGDTLVVWRLDRLGRSMKHIISLVGELNERGVGFRSLEEYIDSNSPGGKLVFHIFAALAEFERSVTQERTQAGLAAARARGRTGGRRAILSTKDVARARELYAKKDMTVEEIGKMLGVSRTTIYRALEREASVSPRRKAQAAS